MGQKSKVFVLLDEDVTIELNGKKLSGKHAFDPEEAKRLVDKLKVGRYTHQKEEIVEESENEDSTEVTEEEGIDQSENDETRRSKQKRQKSKAG